MDNNLDTKLSIYNHHIPTFSSVFRGFSHGFPLLFPIPKGSCPAKKTRPSTMTCVRTTSSGVVTALLQSVARAPAKAVGRDPATSASR